MSLVGAATDGEQQVLQKALFALEHAAGHMSAVDVSNAEMNLSQVRYRPLTQTCIDAATELRVLLGQQGAGFPTGENVGMAGADVHSMFGSQEE